MAVILGIIISMTYLLNMNKGFSHSNQINRLTDNIVERSQVNYTKQFFDNIMYESNPRHTDFDDLPFDGYERFITRQRLYCINDNIVFGLKSGYIVYVYTNRIQ